MITLKIELGVAAERILQNLQLNNKEIEEQITKGLTKAFEEIVKEDDAFVSIIAEATKVEVINLVRKATNSWELKHKINELLAKKFGEKLTEYADKLAAKLIAGINQP